MYSVIDSLVQRKDKNTSNSLADFSKAAEVLGYNPTRNLEDYVKNITENANKLHNTIA